MSNYWWNCANCNTINGWKEVTCEQCNALRAVDRTPPRVRVPRSKKPPWYKFAWWKAVPVMALAVVGDIFLGTEGALFTGVFFCSIAWSFGS